MAIALWKTTSFSDDDHDDYDEIFNFSKIEERATSLVGAGGPFQEYEPAETLRLQEYLSTCMQARFPKRSELMEGG